jgi:arylformamidase
MPADAAAPALPMTAAERERAYSPSSCIGGNYQPFIQAYVDQSRQAHAQALKQGARWLDVRTGPAPAQRMDLCLPAQRPAEGVPVLVFIHGGYWQELSARESLFSAAQCIEKGVAFCAVDYTLAPTATVGQIVAECRQALRVLAAGAAGWGIDARRIVVAGSSAGAHLAAMCCLQVAEPDATAAYSAKPSAAVLISGIFELQPLVGTSINNALGLTEAEAQVQSPALHGLNGFPKTLVCWGQIETPAFKTQSQAFASALQAAGTVCSTQEIPQRNHFDVALDLADPNTELGCQTFKLLGVA